MAYNFAVDFFSGREEQFQKIVTACGLGAQPLQILEVGSFEGRSACWFSDNLLDHQDSQLICVDTFRGGDEHQKFLQTEHPDLLKTFLGKVDLLGKCRANVARSRNSSKVTILEGESASILPTLRGQMFDMIYIDGSHHSEDVLLDGVNAWHLLKDGGALVFDDYTASCFGDRMDIDTFPVQRAADGLQVFFNMEMIHDGTMRALRKVAGAYPVKDVPMALARRAYDLHAQQRDEEAMECLESALRIEPSFMGAMFQKGIIALSHGDYETGWPLFELRRSRDDAALSGVRYQERLAWDGKPTDKRVILWSEEGLGDTIQMLRYVPGIHQKCKNLILEVQPSLVDLCKSNFSCEVVPVGPPHDFDLQCPLLSPPCGPLPIPRAPYLKARPCSGVSHRLGICWQGNPAHARDKARSIPYAALDRLSDFDFLSLQHEDLKSEDIAATAAVIHQLDLVIAVDTMVAHLAGAIGKEVWVMLSVDCDWRWGQGSAMSDWYPSARLFRQHKPGDWAQVLDDVASALAQREKRSALIGAAA